MVAKTDGVVVSLTTAGRPDSGFATPSLVQPADYRARYESSGGRPLPMLCFEGPSAPALVDLNNCHRILTSWLDLRSI
jgi:hypothetical protein